MIKIKDIFIAGAINPTLVAESIRKHSTKKGIGGHSLFLGQVRQDELEGKQVSAIDFTCYREMALATASEIREEIIQKYGLTCAHIYHSLGTIAAGEICLFVFTSAAHRKEAIHACDELVDRIKNEVPIWGKEIFDDQSYSWKENKK